MKTKMKQLLTSGFGVKLLAFFGLGLGLTIATTAQAATTKTWTKFCENQTYVASASAGITQYDQNQAAFIFKVNVAASSVNADTQILRYGASNSNYVYVKTTAGGKYRIEVWRNGQSTNLTQDSTVDVTEGYHVFVLKVRRGDGTTGQLLSTILYMDGSEIAKIVYGQDGRASDLKFSGNPMSTMEIGQSGKENNISMYRINAVESSVASYAADTTDMQTYVADSKEIYPPLVAFFYGSTVVDGATYTAPDGIVYTLAANGNTAVAGGGIQISANKGVSVTPASGNIGNQATTVIIKYTNFDTSSLASTDAKVLIVNHTANTSYKDMLGMAATEGGNIWGLWQNTTWSNNKTTTGVYGSSASDVKQFALGWTQTETAVARVGTYFYMNGQDKAGWSSLHGNLDVDGVWIGGPNEGTGVTPATGMKILGIAVFGGRLSDAEMAAYSFPAVTYTATVSGNTKFSEITTWSPARPASGFDRNSKIVINNTAAAKLTMDEDVTALSFAIQNTSGNGLTLGLDGHCITAAWDQTAAAGGVTVDATGVSGASLARYAVAGAPYSYWYIRGTGTLPNNPSTMPTMPDGYTATAEKYTGTGLRLVVTATSAQFGSVNINFAGGRNSASFNDEAKVGTYETMQGGYSIIGTSWNDLEAKNYTGTATKYIITDGTVKTDGNISVKVTQCNNPYTTGQGDDYKHTITYGYIDDGGNPIVEISNIPFAKYRVILYRATDGTGTFSAAQIGTTSSNTKIYYGPTKSSTTAAVTFFGDSEVGWGKGQQAGYTEGMNYIVSDVLEGTPGSATAYIYSHKYDGRAGVAAIQIVEVGVVAKIGTVGYPSLTAAEAAVQSGETIQLLFDVNESLSTTKTFTLDLNGKTLTGTLSIGDAGAVTLTTLPAANTLKISGSGRLVYNNATLPTVNSIWNSDWTGTFAYGGYNGSTTNWDLTSYYNGANSKFEFNGTLTGGYFAKKNWTLGDLIVNGSITINDGYSTISTGVETIYGFKALKGTGSITTNKSNVRSVLRFDTMDAFTGRISLTGFRVIVGTSEVTISDTTPANSTITLLDKANLTANTLTASSGITVKTAVAGTTTLASATTFADNAELDARASLLTANGTLTFGANTKVRVTTAPTAENPLVKVMSKSNAGQSVFATTVALYVGEATEPTSGNFKLAYNNDGLYVAFVQNFAAEITESTSWSQIQWGGTSSSPFDTYTLTVTGEGIVLTFDQIVNSPASLTIDGSVTIAMADALYEDGCWEKRFATFGNITATGTITFAPLKDGFYGEYARVGTTAFKLRAQNKEVISINMAGGAINDQGTFERRDSPSDNLVPEDDNFYGVAPTKGRTWNNINGMWKNKITTVTLYGSKAAGEDGSVTQRPTIDLSATAGTTWQCGDITNQFLRGYLDDGNGVTVTVHGIPYTSYDVIVYATSDSSLPLAPVTVNDKLYTFSDGQTVLGDAVWGVGKYPTPEIGKNALIVTNCTSDKLTISAARHSNPDGRGTLCGVQVICKGEVAIKSTYVANVNGDATWVTGTGDTNIERLGDAWANSQLSTLTLTNTVSSTLAFNPAQNLTGQVFKVVSEANTKLTIPASSLAKLNFSQLDFSEAAGKVEIDMNGVTEGAEGQTILAGDLTGSGNVTFVTTGAWGAYADATGIHMARTADVTRYNPVTGASQNFTFSYFGTDGVWEKASNWRKATDGLWRVATVVPGDADHAYYPLFIDCDVDVTMSQELEGYNISYAFLGGADVTINSFTKSQKASDPQFIWVDEDSSLTIGAIGAGGSHRDLINFYIAATNGVTLPACSQAFSFNFYLTNNATAHYAGAVTAGTHTFKSISLEVGTDNTKPARHVAKKTLVTLGAAGTTVTFAKADDIVVSLDNKGVTPTYKENVTVMDAVGTYTIKTESTGVYAYVVQYADQWDVVDPLTATIAADTTTDWTNITWTDANSHTFTGLTDAHEYRVTAANGATLNFNAAVTATAIKLSNSENETVTLTKGDFAIPTGLNYTGVAGQAIVTWPVAALVSSTDHVAYTGGAGSEGSGSVDMTLNTENGVLDLRGGTYYIKDNQCSGVQTTVNVTNANIVANGWFGVGKAVYNVGGNSQISGTKFILSQGYSDRDAVFNLGGTASVTCSGTTSADKNTASVMFGHWEGDSTFTISESATFTVLCDVLVGLTHETQTININGGTFTAQGIKASSNASGTNRINLNGGELKLGSTGIDSYAANRTIPVTVGGDAKITSTAAMPITQAITVNAGKKLTLDATLGAMTISGAFVNNGTVKVQGGLVRFTQYRGFVEIGEGGTVGYPIDINDAGVFTVPMGMDATRVTLYKADGTAITPTKTEGGKIYYESSMEDFSAYWKYEFEGNGNNTGTEGTALSWDNDRPFKDNEYVTDEKTGKKSLRVPTRPHRTVSTWPEAATFVMYGTMVGGDNHYQICFGTKSGNLLFLATGDTSKNEVVLCKSTNNTPVPLCTMTVPNAQTTKHLYAFVLKKVGDKSAIDIYLDGALLQPYTFDSEFTLGGGFQIASPHGGPVTGYARTDDNDPAILDFLRVYDKELNSDAMAKYAEEYPYHSPYGTYTRELTSAEGTWVQAGQWVSNNTAVVVSEPGTNSVVQITADVATGLAVNLTEDKTYETVTFGGDGAIAVTNDMVNSGKVKVTGRITVNTSTRLAIDAFETYGSAISIGNGKVLTLDLGNADISKYWSSQSIDLTGAIICNDYKTQVQIEQPKTVKAPRTVTIRIDDASKHAWADIYVPTNDIIGTVSSDNTVTWSWAGSEIQRSDIDFDQTEVAIKIVMESGINLTLDEQLAKADLITVNGGNLNIGTNRNMTVTGAGTIDAKLSDEEKASTTEVTLFDVSGAASLAYRNVTDKDGTKLDVIGSNGKIKVRPETALEGLMFYMACPKPNYHDRDPNGRQSGWIDLVNYGPNEVNLADYKLVRCNMSKEFKVTEAQEAVSNLLSKTIAKGETFRVYTSEEYDTAEDYGGTGREVAWFKTEGGAVVKSDSATGSIMVVPTKVNPKKYPMVRLYKGTEATGFNVVDEVVIPCDIDDDAVVEFGVDATKRERWVVQDGVRTEYGPDVNSLYGVKKAKTDLQLLNAKGFVKAGEDFQVALPVNPFGTNGVALANNEIASVVLEYRTFDDSMEEDAMPTNELALAKGKTDKSQGQLWTNAIPANVMVAGKLIQYRAKITDVDGKTFYAPRFLNKDVGYKWYGAVVQPNLISAPVKDSTDVCVEKLQTFLMFVCGSNKTEMDKDVTSQTLPYKARCAIFDTQTGTYYDNIRVDLRGQTSASFYKKSHAFRFSKVAPLACTNPFDGEEIECRKTSFIAEYGDPIFMRQTLALQVMRESGVKAPFEYPVRLYLNGKFYQLAFHSNRFTDEIVEDYYKLNAKTGYSYKNVGQLLENDWGGTKHTEKKTPDDDNEDGEGAFDVLNAYAHRINTTDQTALTTDAMKYFNIPAWVNYMAATKITQEADDVWTNLGIYINLYDEFYNPSGDDTMMPLAYDQNLSFGQWYRGDDSSRYEHEKGIVVTNDLMKSHPFYGGKDVRYHQWGQTTTTYGGYNRGMEAIFQNATFREALLRRTRTLMDKFLGAPGTAKEDTPIWQWAQAYATAMTDDISVDHDKWKYNLIGTESQYCGQIWIWEAGANAPTFEQGMNELWDTYITQRRIHLYNRHSATNTAFEVGYAQDKNAGIPVAQAATTNLAENGKIYVTDSQDRRNTDKDFDVSNGIIFIRNANEAAVDISGWQLTGLAKIAFAEGTVIPAKKNSVDGKLTVVYDRVEARSTIESMTDPFIVNVDKATEYFTPGNTTVCLRDEKGTEVQGTTFYITATTDPETGKVVVEASTSEPAGTSSINLPMEWMEKHGIVTSVPASVLAEEMNTPMEGGNGATPWESYALGLSPEKPDSKPVIAPVQTSDKNNVTFKLTNVTPVTGATVTYKVWMGDTPGAKTESSKTEAAYDATLAMPLPENGVKYYTIEVKTVTSPVTK